MIPLGYLLAGLALYYPTTHVLVYAVTEDAVPRKADWFFAVAIAAMLMIVWPFVLLAGGSFVVSKRLWTGNWRMPWRKSLNMRSYGE